MPQDIPEIPNSAAKQPLADGLDFNRPARPLREFAGREDFPECVLGELIDINGFEGVALEIVKQSLKVRSAEKITQSFNIGRLRTLYAPVVHREVPPYSPPVERSRPAPAAEPEEPEPAAPPRRFIATPDFTLPLQPISGLVGRADFPQCAYGQHVEINGFTGVVVELVKDSLKVKSEQGLTRSFNAPVLRKLHARPPAA